MIKKIAFTMYSVTDMKRARDFYENAFGLEVSCVAAEDKWVEYDLEGGCFAITSMVDDVKPSAQSGGQIAFEVDDVDAMTKKLQAKGSKILVEPFDTPVCRMSVVTDTEGNGIVLHKVTD